MKYDNVLKSELESPFTNKDRVTANTSNIRDANFSPKNFSQAASMFTGKSMHKEGHSDMKVPEFSGPNSPQKSKVMMNYQSNIPHA